MHRAFHAEISPGEVRLSVEESHHLFHVLRLKVGEEIELVDGAGTTARGRITDLSARGVRVAILSVSQTDAISRVHLAFGIPKGAALDFIMRRCAEVGIASFQPLLTDHSLPVRQWNETRWNKILVEVGKQCQAPIFPKLFPPLPLAGWLTQRNKKRTLVFCHENRRDPAASVLDPGGEFELLTGAEGGWSENEARLIDESGAISLSLGRNRLRAETAALVGVTLIKRAIGELG